MISNEAVLSAPWYRSLSGPQWKTLIAANLGWIFDSFEFFALFLTVGFALHRLLDSFSTQLSPAMRAISLPRPCSVGLPAG